MKNRGELFGQSRQCLGVFRRNTGFQSGQCCDTVQRSAVKIMKTENSGHTFRNCSFSAGSRTIDRDDRNRLIRHESPINTSSFRLSRKKTDCQRIIGPS
ncbi:hypothetical protein EVA_20425 [gut metagenome]|uniref:Uncharacterized protein n=1 Tax=gut metagenome TaxID=749906 RepID=J9BV62_9ZZZZ